MVSQLIYPREAKKIKLKWYILLTNRYPRSWYGFGQPLTCFIPSPCRFHSSRDCGAPRVPLRNCPKGFTQPEVDFTGATSGFFRGSLPIHIPFGSRRGERLLSASSIGHKSGGGEAAAKAVTPALRSACCKLRRRRLRRSKGNVTARKGAEELPYMMTARNGWGQ